MVGGGRWRPEMGEDDGGLRRRITGRRRRFTDSQPDSFGWEGEEDEAEAPVALDLRGAAPGDGDVRWQRRHGGVSGEREKGTGKGR